MPDRVEFARDLIESEPKRRDVRHAGDFRP